MYFRPSFRFKQWWSNKDYKTFTFLACRMAKGWETSFLEPFNWSPPSFLASFHSHPSRPPILFCLTIKIASWKFSVFTLSLSCLSVLTRHFHDEIDVLTTIVMMNVMKFENWFVLCWKDAQFLSCSSFWISAFWNVKIWNGRKTLMILESN